METFARPPTAALKKTWQDWRSWAGASAQVRSRTIGNSDPDVGLCRSEGAAALSLIETVIASSHNLFETTFANSQICYFGARRRGPK